MLARTALLSLLSMAWQVIPNVAAEESVHMPSGTALNDAKLTRSALSALDSDPQLRDIPLIVSVVDRQAVLGGVVPTVELSQRAEAIVRRATGVEVKNRCLIQPRPDPLIQAVADRITPSFIPETSKDLPGIVVPPRMNSNSTKVSHHIRPPVDKRNADSHTYSQTSPPVVAFKIDPQSAQRPSLLLEPTASPTGPRPVAEPPVPTHAPVPTRLTTHTATHMNNQNPAMPSARDCSTLIQHLIKDNPRFAKLNVQFHAGIVNITSSTTHEVDAWDFAENVRKIPGVRSVIVRPEVR